MAGTAGPRSGSSPPSLRRGAEPLVPPLAEVRAVAPGRFLRHVLTLAGATGVSQFLLLLTGPVLTRLYDPVAWGTFSLVMAFVGTAAVVTALCYDMAIVGARTEDDAAALTVATLWLGPLVSAIALGVLALLIGARWLGYGGLPWSSLAWAGALLVLLQVFVSLRSWHLRAERFGLLGRTTITQNVGRALFPVAAAPLAGGWLGLLLGETLGRSVGILPLIRERWAETRAAFGRQSWASMRDVLRRYAVFGVIGMPSSLLDAVALALPLPLIAAGFGAEAAGQFALAQRVLQAPVGLVGKSVADAFHARLSVHHRERPAHVPAFFHRTTLLLVALALVPSGIVLLLGAGGFAVIFGGRWGVGGTLAVVMLPWAMSQLVVSPLSRVVLVLGGQREKLIYDIAAVLLVVGAYGWGHAAGWGLVRTVFALSLGQAAAYGIYFLVLRHVVQRRG